MFGILNTKTGYLLKVHLNASVEPYPYGDEPKSHAVITIELADYDGNYSFMVFVTDHEPMIDHLLDTGKYSDFCIANFDKLKGVLVKTTIQKT